jgi:hypothetical protein
MAATATSKRKLTPPELARLWGISPDKIAAWIRSGELRAINAARDRRNRPRYLIDLADVAAFEQTRTVIPKVPAPRRRPARPTDIHEFF